MGKKLKTFLRERRAVVLGGFLVFCAGILAALVILQFDFNFEPEGHLAVYFFDPSQGRLSPEWRDMPEQADTTHIIGVALEYLSSEPRNNSHSPVWPEHYGEELITALILDGDTLIVELAEAYLYIPPLSEALFRSALTLTVVSIPEIENVRLVVPGSGDEEDTEWNESIVTIANNPSISPARIAADQFTLFFVHESGEGLAIEEYLASEVDRLRREVYIMERLIAGPTCPYMISFIPPETQVRGAFGHMETGALYVDLSVDFVNRFAGTTAQARLMLASITNTLIENTSVPGARRVVFLINSERRDDFHGVGDFGSGFAFDGNLLIGEDYEDQLNIFPYMEFTVEP